MNHNKTIKRVIDVLMTTGLLFLMAYQVIGDVYHEWLGLGMLILFLCHNVLNYRWYKGFFHGKYSLTRILCSVINVAVLVAIIITGFSGIVMSRHVFAFLPIRRGMSLARTLHLAGSYWSFVLMSVHLGLHWNMVIGFLNGTNGKKKENRGNQTFTAKALQIWLFRILATVIAVYGAVLFGQSDIYSYLFLQNPFAFLDYEKGAIRILLEYVAMMGMWIYVSYYLMQGLRILSVGTENNRRKKINGSLCMIVATLALCVSITSVSRDQGETDWSTSGLSNSQTSVTQNEIQAETETSLAEHTAEQNNIPPTEEFILIQGKTFELGSPESEGWRSTDETQHTVSLSDFYMSAYEVTQAEYQKTMGTNPSSFSGDNLPVEMVSWLDAVNYCNARSEQEGLTPVYHIDGENVSWDRSADGYRLPTEAEWEYACRAGTMTPFNTENSISAEEANYYGHYPYDIEENYFEQDNLTTKPGEYRQTTVAVDSFSPNTWGLYNMHGNVSEWVWDYYGTYTDKETNPTGPETGNLRVYRGGGWNDFAKNMRSAYRATMKEDMFSFNIGIRLLRNAVPDDGVIGSRQNKESQNTQGKILIAYFSWGGNTRGVAEEIQAQTGADLFEIQLVEPYSDDYNTVLDQAQHDQNIQARPELVNHVENMEEYDTILLGYPNWWASIPMPIASFLEEYDFSGKTIIPFCSHGGGRFGQSQTAIAKLAPDSAMGEGLSIHYSGGETLSFDIDNWLKENEILD